MGDSTHLTPQYGRRTLADIIDQVAAEDPTRPLFHHPVSSNPKDGFQPLTYGQFANAVNYVAYDLLKTVDKQYCENDDFPTIAYIGPGDAGYMIVMLACIKAHMKALFISPRNSEEAQVALLKGMDTRLLMHSKSFHAPVQSWVKSYPVQTVEIPKFEVWVNGKAPPFPYNKPFDEAKWHPLVALHTSGSTGIPKPIVIRQGSFAIADGMRDAPDIDGYPSLWPEWGNNCSKMLLCMPLFHAGGVTCFAVTGIYYGVELVLGIPDRPLSAELAIECLDNLDCDACVFPPFILDELGKMDAGVEALSKIKYAAYGGGSLSDEAGSRLIEAGGVTLINVISSTEFMYLLQFQTDRTLWSYVILNEKDMGLDFRLIAKENDEDPGIYEMRVRRIHPTDPQLQTIFYTFPEKDEWTTGDLWKPHPTLAHHWTYYGRGDDIIVFSNGEKLNPVTIELAVQSHPAVKGALVVGQRRFQPALILELGAAPKDDAAAEAFINSIWPLVEEANKVTVAHGRIDRSLVVFSDPSKPFPRSGKGSIQRLLAVNLYEEEINRLYERADEAIDVYDATQLNLESQEALTNSIVEIMESKLGKAPVQPGVDLFSIGVDSLDVMNLSRLLHSLLRAAGVAVDQNTIAPRVIYGHPTPKGLAEHLFSVYSGGSSKKGQDTDVEALAGIVSKYTADLPAPNSNQKEPLNEGQTVIVTGTTGSLGAYILDRLVSNPQVAKIIAFNRGDDGGRSRQPSYNRARGLTTDFAKVEFLGVDLSQPLLGLGQAKYNEILATADRIIHNAWPVNFNISLVSFEPYILGVRHLVDFSNQAAKKAPIIFISSVATTDGWTSSDPVPEQHLDDLSLASKGYGQSKLAGSLILEAAAKQSGVPSATVRVGQIAGPRAKKGVWNKQEFIPSLIASSVYLGILPDTVGQVDVVDWIPIEDLAGLVLDIGGVSTKLPLSDISGYFHGVNPTTTTWTQVAGVLKEYYNGRIKEIVPLETWLKALEESASAVTVDAEKNPGIKLIDTYRALADANKAKLGHVYLDVARTVRSSPTIGNLKPVDAALVRNWCDQWAL